MHLFTLLPSEHHSVYRALDGAARERQLSYLRSMIALHLAQERHVLSLELIKSLHFHATAGLLSDPGKFRNSYVRIDGREFMHCSLVPEAMENMINRVNRRWHASDAIALAAFVFWRICKIHPFLNGNCRTARAVCYFILCMKMEQWIGGNPILPQRMYEASREYARANLQTDQTVDGETVDTSMIESLIRRDLP